MPLLYAAANLMARDDCTPAEIKETFDDFIEMVVMKQAAGHVPPRQPGAVSVSRTLKGMSPLSASLLRGLYTARANRSYQSTKVLNTLYS